MAVGAGSEQMWRLGRVVSRCGGWRDSEQMWRLGG